MVEIKIKNDIENKLMNRRDILVEMHYTKEPTPKLLELRKLLAAQLGVNTELLVIEKIKQHFGMSAICNVVVYKTKEELEKFEPKYIIGRNVGTKIKGGTNKKKKKKKEAAKK